MDNVLESLRASCPFTANVKLQFIKNEDNEREGSNKSKEQLLKLQVQLPELWKESFYDDKTYLLVAVDTSGSMSGSPIEQVRTALNELLCQTSQCSHIKTDVLSYSSEVTLLDITDDNYTTRVQSLKASGTTNFVLVFQKLNLLLKEHGGAFDRAVIVFMTDGQDTVNDRETLDTETRSWKDSLEHHGLPVTVHSVGFSQGHNYKFLSGLISTGNGNGMYRYCEASDGPNILMEKLQELFDFILQGSGTTVDVHLSINGDNKIDNKGKGVQTCCLTGTVDRSLDAPVINAETWILNQTPPVHPMVDVSLRTKFKINHICDEVTFPCTVNYYDLEVLTSVKDKCLWNLKILQRNADYTAAKLAEVISKNTDAAAIEKKTRTLQERLSRIPLFRKDMDKDLREEIRKTMADIQEKINKICSLVTDYARKETVSVGMLARAHDMRYQAQFNKSRRNRLMDRRATKNITVAKAAQEKLAALCIDRQEVNAIQQTTCDFYFCALSQNSVKDVLLGDENDDLIGFGLAVKRSEVVLDEPSLIWIHNISGTIVSRSAMLDALEFKLKIDGQLEAHGGFNFDELGVTTVGLGREPINAWLPLYVNKHHWEKVKILLRPDLGYFCTLDPLGYDYKQIDVMFMTLGSMISGLTEIKLGEHQIKMIFAFQRTCQACLIDFELIDQVTTLLKNFVTSPAGRTKDVVPNLLTLVGYLVSMPTNNVRTVLGSKDTSESKFNIRRFWIAFVAEVLRRSGGNLYKETRNNIILGYIDALLNVKDVDECECKDPESSFKTMLEEIIDNKELVPSEFDVKSGLPCQAVPLTHSEKYDNAMEIWALSKCGVIRNKNQAEKVGHATKLVNEWIKEGQKISAMAIDPDCCGEDEKKDNNLDYVTISMLKMLVQVINKLTDSSYPTLSSVLGCIGYVNFWLEQDGMAEFDQNGGLPPTLWIDGVKKSVTDVYRNTRDCTLDDDYVVIATAEELNTQPSNNSNVDDQNVHMTTGKDNSDVLTDSDDDYQAEYSVPDNVLDNVNKTIHSKHRLRIRSVKLPTILQLLTEDVNVLQMCRVLVCQVLLYPSNSKARGAIQSGEFLDLSVIDNADLNKEVSRIRNMLQTMRQNAIKDYMEQVVWKRTNHCMIVTDSIWAFIGYLMTTYTDRNEGISWLLSTMSQEDTGTSVPLLAEKIKILFLGKYEEYPILAKGNIYIPEGRTSKQFSKVLGEEVWNAIEIELRSKVTLHVYRESDIPNRHGHCNSNPYISNTLRIKLGMPLLKEETVRTRPRRIRSKRT